MRLKTIFGLVVGVSVALLIAYSCVTSRSAPRTFVLKRDYRDMRRVFLTPSLPPSFTIWRVRNFGLSSVPGPDGPSPVLYEATVAGDEYATLVSKLSNSAKRMEKYFDYRRAAALDEFDEALARQLADEYFREVREWAPLILECQTTVTADGIPYRREAYIAVDDRSSETMRLFITTKIPLEGEEGYPEL